MPTLLAIVAIVAAAAVAAWWIWSRRRVTSSPRAHAAPPEPADAPRSAVAADVPARKSEAKPLPSTLIDPMLVVEKSTRTLTVFSGGQPLKVYPIALGPSPVGDKEREGDGRTPEGHFYVCTRNERSAHKLALGLSYPNEEDAERGLRDGLVDKRERRAIDDAIRHYRRPPWNTKLGGEIMIHGGGTASDWTGGCIALDDDDVGEIFPLLPMGTTVEIKP